MSDTDSAAALIGTVLAGRYEVTGVLGAGGMGVVLEARQIAVDRQVAVKLLHPHFGQNRHAVARFVREMQVTSRLEHPSTVRVYDFGEVTDSAGTHLFLVMELVQGRTLGKLLMQGPLAHARIVGIAAQVARALEAAHGEGIVHRDLKPDNVMIADRYGAADVVKVLDFGIARFVEDPDAEGARGGIGKLTAEGAVVGTPAYMSPEQATGAPLGPASDLYSLGVMLFEMATGSVPFAAPTTVSLMVKHVQEPPPRPSDLAPMPALLDALILKCLEKDPAKRPASAKEVADRLDAIARDLEAPGAARVLRGEGARFEAQKAGALAADTAKTQPRPVKAGSELPAKSASPLPWVAAGAGVIAAIVIAIVALPGDERVPVRSDPSVVPAATLEVVNEVAAADVVSAPIINAMTISLEPSAPISCPIERVEAARAAARQGQADALDRAREAVGACGGWAVAHVVLGQVEHAAKRYDAALASYRKAAELAPGWGVPRFDVALVELAAERPDRAKEELDWILARDRDWPSARLVRAQADLALGDHAAALEDARAATMAAPDQAAAWYMLGEAHRALGPAGSNEAANDSYCKAKALGMAAAAARCDAAP